jgi:hypothetical protein
MVTMDGNNSLKRFERRERLYRADGTTIPGSSVERVDTRKAPRDFYLLEEFVNLFAKHHASNQKAKGKQKEGVGPKVGCGDGWKNAQEKYTSKAWGMYRETGIFILLCRHAFVFSICDMVESGEG